MGMIKTFVVSKVFGIMSGLGKVVVDKGRSKIVVAITVNRFGQIIDDAIAVDLQSGNIFGGFS